jgi:hypothetical protein
MVGIAVQDYAIAEVSPTKSGRVHECHTKQRTCNVSPQRNQRDVPRRRDRRGVSRQSDQRDDVGAVLGSGR